MTRCKKCFGEYDEVLAAGVCPHCGYYEGEQQDDPRYLPMGSLLHGRYIIGGVIGVGGFGITYKAWDNKYNICKAVKEYFQQGVVNRIPGDTQVFVSAPKRQEEFEYGKERLLEEARIVAKFQSSSIVRVDDFFEENGTSYMVMEFLAYQTLEDYLINKKRPLNVDEAITIGAHICEALEEIHGAGVIHRDISPDNIFVSDNGEVKIIDFGSARLSEEDTDSRLIVLKPGYAPPEQYEKIDPNNDLQQSWTDVYALGATLYASLTGHVPAESSDRKADYDAHTDRVCYPHEINQNIPDYLSNTIMTAMAINIHERFQNATELKEALLQERKVLPVEIVRKKKKVKRTAGIAAGIAVVALLLGIFAGRLSKNKAEVVLDPASITVWYAVSASENEAIEKENALQAILDALYDGDQFAKVDIDMRGIPEEEYEAELSQAYSEDNMPSIFEAVNATAEYMNAAQSMDSVMDAVSKDSCYFLNKYKEYFESQTQLPTAFNVPVVYINTEVVTDLGEITQLSSLDALFALHGGQMKSMPMSVKDGLKDTYGAMFDGFKNIVSGMESRDAFLQSRTAVYFADTSDYFRVREALPGKFAMLSVDANTIPCSFTNCWSMSATDGAEKVAAEVFVSYLLSNNAQDLYYLQASNAGLPLEKVTFDGYDDVRRQFEEIVGHRDAYVFR